MRHRPLQGVPVFNFPATSPLADTHLAPSACDDDRRPSSEGVVSQALDTYKTHGLSIERDLGLSVEHKSLAPTASSMREDLDMGGRGPIKHARQECRDAGSGRTLGANFSKR